MILSVDCEWNQTYTQQHGKTVVGDAYKHTDWFIKVLTQKPIKC